MLLYGKYVNAADTSKKNKMVQAQLDTASNCLQLHAAHTWARRSASLSKSIGFLDTDCHGPDSRQSEQQSQIQMLHLQPSPATVRSFAFAIRSLEGETVCMAAGLYLKLSWYNVVSFRRNSPPESRVLP